MGRVTLLVTVLLFSSVLSQSPSKPQEWTYNHIFGVSDRNPFADSLNTPDQRHKKEALRFLLEYYESLPEKMSKGNVQRRASGIPGSLKNTLNFFGYPPLENEYIQVYEPEKLLSDDTRTSAEIIKNQWQYEMRIKSFRATGRKVFERLKNINNAVESAGKATIKDAGLGWGKFVHTALMNYTSDDDIHKCELRNNIAYRVNGTWSVGVELTNDFRHLFKKEGSRQYLSQLLYIDSSDIVRSFPLRIFVGHDANSTRYWTGSANVKGPNSSTTRFNVSTVLSIWGGRLSLNNHGMSLPTSTNLAISAAEQVSRNNIKQMYDTKTVSNAAILIFPIFLTTLPLALFADVSNLITLWYAIFTDILTVLPLAIKGVELLNLDVHATRTVVYGYDGTDKTGTMVAYTWSVRCKSSSSTIVFGAVFVSIALFAMLLGIVLEFFARAKLQHTKKLSHHKDQGFGIEYLWEKDGPCVECNCEMSSHIPSWNQTSLGNGLIGRLVRNRARSACDISVSKDCC